VNRIRLSAFVAVSVFAAGVAVAQAPPSGAPINRGPATQTVKPPVQPLGNVVASNPAGDWTQFQANARNRSATLTCQGPLTLEVKAKDPRDASKGVYYLLSFKEAAAARDVKPGECWRDGGYSVGSGSQTASLNRGLKKGDIFYDPPVIKCPAINTMKIENGKVTGTFNETLYSDSMFRAASESGRHAFITKWLNSNDSTGQASGWGHYVAVPYDEVLPASPAVPGCRG
jgi:hypothetical protein